MKTHRILLVILIAVFLVSPNVSAADFDWMRDFNIKAEADPSGLRARLEARFQLGDLKIKTVLGSVDKPADAYMLLRLGEISNYPIDHIIEQHKVKKNKGWGALAKSLGIKPGSENFHALKHGQDLYDDDKKGKGKQKEKSKGKRRN